MVFCEKSGKKADLRSLKGEGIPFEDNSMDIVVSWNAIHYNGTRKAVQNVVDEFYRILKPGGVVILSTLHPDNAIFDRMKEVEDGSFLIEKDSPYDNRQGLHFFATKNEEELADIFKGFSTVETGKVYFDLFNHHDRHAASLIHARK
jgi:SAM-dependent methyltransferase